MVADVSWYKALSATFPGRKVSRKGTKLSRGTKAVKRLGLKPVTRARVRKLNTIKHPAILTIRWKTNCHSCHAVAWDPVRKRVIDPWMKSRGNAFYEKRLVRVTLVLKRR